MKIINNLFASKYLVPILLTALFTIIYSYHSLFRHLTFNSHAFDLGIYAQISYLYSQGLTPFSTLKHIFLLADHFGLILFLLSPIYKLFPSASTLLIIQAFFVALSSLPIFLIALDKLKKFSLSFLITLTYLTSVGITSAINFDFHLTTISVLPLSLILFAWYFKKWKLYWTILIFSITFKEDIPLFILGLGIYQIFSKEVKPGFATVVFALSSFYIIKFLIMPFLWLGGSESYITTSILPLDSPIDLLSLILIRPTIFLDQMINSPIKVATFELLYKQFSYTPLLSPLSWLTVIPALFIRFSTTYSATWTTLYHHNANLEPFLAISTILAISYFKLPKLAISLLLIFFLVTNGLAPTSMIWEAYQKNITEINDFKYLYQGLNSLPATVAISAQSPLVPHLANRQNIYLFPEIYNANYIVLDTSLSSYPINKSGLKYKISLLKKSPYWQIKKEVKTLIIFQKRVLP